MTAPGDGSGEVEPVPDQEPDNVPESVPEHAPDQEPDVRAQTGPEPRIGPAPEPADPRDFYSSREAEEQVKLTRNRDSAIALGGGNAYNVARAFIGAEPPADVQAVPCEPRVVARITALHHAVDGQDAMLDRLAAERVVVLAGRPGSGRQSTALTLLAALCGSQRVAVVHSGSSDGVQELALRAEELFAEQHGYLVDLGDQPPPLPALETLRHQAHTRDAYVVLVAGESTDPDRVQPFGFAHRRPDPMRVLEAHLADAIAGVHPGTCEQDGCSTGHSRDFVARMLADGQVRHVVDRMASLRAVADFAASLAGHVHSGQEGVDAAVARWRDRLRRLAKEILHVPQSGGEPAALDPHRQAVRITYALFHGHPLSDVFAAGELLSATVLPRFERREPVPNNHLFERELDELVPAEMRFAASASVDGTPRDNPRRAWLVDEELMPAVVEVVWHEYDGLRAPLREWLTTLAGGPLHRVRVRAAQIAGILLGHDFDSVYRDLVGPWARGNAAFRQSAALAMELAAGDRQLAPRVRQQVQSWSRSSNPALQDTAARTYGTLFGAQDEADAIWSLRELGKRPETDAAGSVSFAMASLFLGGATKSVLDALGGWALAGDDHLPRHAVRTMLVLGRFSAGPDHRDRPVLAHLAMQDSAVEASLVRLWLRALAGQDDAERAWDLMRRWLLAADEDREFAAFLESFLPRVCAGRLSGRSLFRFAVWTERHPSARVLAGARALLGPPAA